MGDNGYAPLKTAGDGSIRENVMLRVDTRLPVQGCCHTDRITARSEWLAHVARAMDLGLLDCVGPSESWLRMSQHPMQYGMASYSCPWHCCCACLCHFTLDNHSFLMLNVLIAALTLA